MSQSSTVSVLEGRKVERLNSGLADQITDRKFNAIMCATLLWGFVANALIVGLFADSVCRMAAEVNPWVFIIGCFVVSLAGIIMAMKSHKPAVSFLGFNLLVLPFGVDLCLVVPFMPGVVVTKALLLTGIVTATMILLGLVRPQLFLGIGRALFIALIVGFVAELIATFAFHYTGGLFDWLFVLIFSGYIGYDIAKSQVYPKTVDNAIDCALDIYIDIFNLFVRLLSILSREN